MTVAQGESGVQLVPVVTRVGSHPGKGNGELSFPAGAIKILEVHREGEGFFAPVCQSKKSTYTDAPEAAGVCSLRAIESPVELPLGSGGVKIFVSFPVIGLLIDHQSLCSTGNQFSILRILHGSDFNS